MFREQEEAIRAVHVAAESERFLLISATTSVVADRSTDSPTPNASVQGPNGCPEDPSRPKPQFLQRT